MYLISYRILEANCNNFEIFWPMRDESIDLSTINRPQIYAFSSTLLTLTLYNIPLQVCAKDYMPI